MPEVRRGTLLIADIGGYTNFLTAVELEHSTDILSDLVGAIVAQASGAFQLAKLEGDAVFASRFKTCLAM
jgi:class 3 adenylate cyclase